MHPIHYQRCNLPEGLFCSLAMAVDDVKPALGKMYSLTEVKQHNTEEDCWIVVRGKV